ncbi:MAG: histidine phosphatase family protein [Halofilum sp. (in: g-proteobacteria)]|nr:histidine phosphatase family protein [Halofilum sp. (in: g-proteobacteria)]
MRPVGARHGGAALAALLVLLVAVPRPLPAAADARALVERLRDGGHVLYFRHASTDWSTSDDVRAEGDWTSCDPGRMRQLSQQGRDNARAVGAAMRRLGVPVDAVYASPYCRCVQTAELLDLGPVTTTRDVLNARAARYVGGREALRATARRRLGTPPPAGSNSVIVAHGNVFLLAAGQRPPEGGAAVVRPTGDARFDVLGTITADDWLRLDPGH